MQIYLINICDFNEIDIQNLTKFISMGSIPKYRYFDDLKRHVVSEAFKYVGYRLFTGINRHPKVTRNRYGKPYYEKCDIFFNISHAGGYVVMVIDKKEVGIDIEPNLNIELDELLDMFHPREKKQIMMRSLGFHELWCAREAYLKYSGIGFANGVGEFFILKNEKMTVNDFKGRRISCNLQKVNILDKYTIMVCSSGEVDKKVEIVDKTKFMNYFKEKLYDQGIRK